MDGFGTMRDKIDIKILILFILRRLPAEVDSQTLSSIALADGTVGYFEYAECLSELIESGHVEKQGSGYRITEKGSMNCEIVESSLPYTVRSRLEKTVQPLAEGMRRRAMIGTAHERSGDGQCYVKLSLSDGAGPIMESRFLCAGEEQASRIEARFRDNAEVIYNTFMGILLE